MVYAEFVENGSKLSSMWSVGGCSELTKKQYRFRLDKMFARIHWELCKKYSIGCAEKWYNHLPSSVCRSEDGSI